MSTTFLYTSSAISTQNDFSESGFMEKLVAIENNNSLIEPDYKEFIQPMMIRRMSKATKMSIACAFKCLQDFEELKLDAIIVGTGLGSVADTERFLKVSTSKEQRVLPPTSFIQSGHNTIAGQIALLLKNDSYNMTHVQQALSFEHTLLDSVLSISEGKQMVLAGAVDEYSPLLSELADRFQLQTDSIKQLNQGAGFFLLGPDRSKAVAEVISVRISQFDDLKETILSFLKENNLGFVDIEMGFIGYNLSNKKPIDLPFKSLCYTDYSGRHFSSSAFGLHMANNYVQQDAKEGAYVLVVNIASNNELGLTLLRGV